MACESSLRLKWYEILKTEAKTIQQLLAHLQWEKASENNHLWAKRVESGNKICNGLRDFCFEAKNVVFSNWFKTTILA